MAPPNILWVTLDSVRADHTSLDGYARDTTPEIARIGDSGYAFPNCISHGKSTLPSSGAILTGLAPSRNTLGISGQKLPNEVTTVAERFRDAGYRTACLSRNSFLSEETGLDRGFDRFQWLASETITDVGLSTLFRYAMNLRSHSAGFSRDTAKHSTPFLMNEVAKDWLGDLAGRDEPFFFYLHYNEPHRPYYPPLDWLDTYADEISMSPSEAAEFAMDVHYNLDEIVANGCNLTDEEWEALVAMYDTEIAYTDEMVGRLVNDLESRGLEDTVVVVTADHGELFGEHGLLSHSYVLSDAVTRVPLTVRGLPEELVVDEDDLVQHADLMTTLLAIAGADVTDTIGVDLRMKTREYAVSQRSPQTFEKQLSHNPSFDTSKFHKGLLTAIRSHEYRYQESEERSSLFALPDEEKDVAKDDPDVVEELSSELSDWIAAYGEPVDGSSGAEFSDAARRQLKDLGYID